VRVECGTSNVRGVSYPTINWRPTASQLKNGHKHHT
jgi:hypothetical protein